MWRGHQTLRGGTVHVDVLPPVDTSEWSVATMNDARRRRAGTVRRDAGRHAVSPSGKTDPTPPRSADGSLLWSRSEEMTGFEALMWRVEADPRMRSTVVIVETLDREPDWDRFVAATDWASRVVPRFRERIVTPFLGAGTPHWALDHDFDLHYHLRHLRLPEGAGTDGLFTLRRAGRDDPARPVAPAVGGHARRRPARRRGRAAVQAQPRPLRRDGPRAAAGRAALAHPGAHHRQAPAARPDGRGPDPVPGAHAPGPQRPRSRRRRRRAGCSGWRRRWSAPTVPCGTPSATSSRRGGCSRRRPRPPLPVLAHRSPSWRFRTLDVPFADLRAAGKAAGGSINDSYLAVAARGVPPLLGAPAATRCPRSG